jgi:hypothetical protein
VLEVSTLSGVLPAFCIDFVAGFVGHVIGLGDRHLSNILVDQLTWGALHIDFGDVSISFDTQSRLELMNPPALWSCSR